MLRLLGSPAIQAGSGVNSLTLSRSAWLLFYLAYHGEWSSRDDLSFFLRPEAGKEIGRQYLRRLLSSAKRLPWSGGLEVELDRLRWDVETDVARFYHAARAGRWFDAIQLYRGPLLQGLDASYLPSYDAWLHDERKVLETLWRDCMSHYAVDLESAGQHREAAQTAERLLQHDTLDEEALRTFVRNASLSGQRMRALETAATFYKELREELSMEPTCETKELIAKVQAAKPLKKRETFRTFGRRQDDLTITDDRHYLEELSHLLKTPGSRLLALSSVDDTTTIIVAKRVTEARVALKAILDLAEHCILMSHHTRALELLTLALNHPDCDAPLSERIEVLWSSLHNHLPIQFAN